VVRDDGLKAEEVVGVEERKNCVFVCFPDGTTGIAGVEDIVGDIYCGRCEGSICGKSARSL